MLYLISLGLFDKDDISLKAIKSAKKCDKLYLEKYTNYHKTSAKALSAVIGKKILEITRKNIEDNSKKLLKEAKDDNIAVFVAGDALTFTTHIALVIEAKNNGIKTNIIHGSSILTAIGETGLSLYKFGAITSIPLNNKNIETPYNILKNNKKMNLHTLILLEKTLKINEAIHYLLQLEESKNKKVFNKETGCVACSAIGSNNAEILYKKAKDLLKRKFNKFPQCLIIPGKLHFIEEEMLEFYRK